MFFNGLKKLADKFVSYAKNAKNGYILMGLISLVILSVGLVVFLSFTPHITDKKAVNSDEYIAMFGQTDLPNTAQNIRYITSSVSLGGRAYICRFEAPVQDCIIYAKKLCKRYQNDDRDYDQPHFISMSERPEKPDLSVYGIRDLSWFDIEKMEAGLTFDKEYFHCPFIWIDTNRKVFYLWWTD